MIGPALVKHSVRIAGHATSVSLEAPFWATLREIAARRRQSVNSLLAEIDDDRAGNLSSAIRIFVLECCRRGELAAVDRAVSRVDELAGAGDRSQGGRRPRPGAADGD